LRAGDIIMELDNVKMKFQYDWDSALRGLRIGQLVAVEILRKNPVNNQWTREEAQVQILESPEAKDDKKGSKSGMPDYHKMFGSRPNLGGRR
jgi:S1-C subfamily serine protease